MRDGIIRPVRGLCAFLIVVIIVVQEFACETECFELIL